MNINKTVRRGSIAAAAIMLGAVALTGCSTGSGTTTSAGDGTGTINVWSLGGTDQEVAALKDSISGFNKSQKDVTAKLRILPGDNYTTTILNTPKDKLPDVLEIDGPTLASFAYNGKLSPISDYVSKNTIANATDGSKAEGTYNGKLYGLAQFDSAMGLWGNKSMLDAAGVKYPTSVKDAWTADQFSAALKALAANNPKGTAITINEGGLSTEWGTYGFSPLVWSAGGNLMKDGKSAGALNSSDSAKALTEFATWKQYSDADADGNAFLNGRVGLAMGGHWNYPTFSAKFQSNLVALPLPNMGNGVKAGAGSLTWGIGASTKNGKAAGKYMDYLLNDKSVDAMTSANGAPPATKSVFDKNTLYSNGGALSLWGDQLSHACPSDDITATCIAVYRPVTAGYPTITAKFSSALAAIWGGADATSELTKAAESIDSNFADNDGYK